MRKWTFGFWMVACVLLCPLQAVFVATSEPNAQDEAPENPEAWEWMGRIEGGGAVYLGGGWFLTAGQLGTDAAAVTFQGEARAIDPESWTPILHSLELPVNAQLFRVMEPEALPAEGSSILNRELELNEPLLLIGPGHDVRNEIVGMEGEQRFYQAESMKMKWGRSIVSRYEELNDGKGFRSRTFDTSLAHGQAQALEGDVGGGVFVVDKDSGRLVLAGVMIASKLRKDPLGTYAFKAPSVDMEQSSWTRSVDLFHYRDQIQDILVPQEMNVWLWVGVFVGFVGGLLLLGRMKR